MILSLNKLTGFPQPLVQLTNLKSLFLARTEVSDLSALTTLAKLKELDLSGTQVSDLSPLSALIDLKSLSLRGTKVNPKQVKALKKTLPKLGIDGP